jgi:predicted ATPase/class 3 adenylate cyclase
LIERSGAQPAPTGTVTFLFSDIEGSTRRWERDRAAMQDAVRRHDALMRSAIASHAGNVFKTIGDAFCAAFARAEDALAASLEAQRALAAEDFEQVGGVRVRMALHTGTADERDGDYFGPAVNRVARLLAVGHGGQVLVSGATRQLLHGALPGGASLRDMGAHRLKDLARPEHVFQLEAPGLDADFPALRSLATQRDNLPLQTTSFVGREREVLDVAALVREHRLVTLGGAGGIGKTRAALQVGASQLGVFDDGVWFVELAPLSDGALIPRSIAAALDLRLPPDREPLPALVALLKHKQLLLVVDNCEHVIDAAASAASAILHGCAKVSVLATSRQPLGVAGEAMYAMPPLAVPGHASHVTADEVKAYGATALFVERAVSADARFSLTDQNAPVIADICRRLDGIALAIELAAARVRMLSLPDLRRRLDERFRLLTGGSRTALPRQQTLRALIDWSYDLLDERERALFRNTAIFVDGFTLDGASAIQGDDPDVFGLLASLVDKSLVVADLRGETTRYRLLESMRAYALERLDASGERARLAARHLDYFRALADRAERAWETTGRDTAFMEAHAPELEDLRAALDWSLDGGDVLCGAALAAAIGRPWSRLGLSAEGIARLERFVAAVGERDARLLARLWTSLAWLVGGTLHTAQGFEAAVRAVEYARAAQDAPTLLAALGQFGVLAARLRRFEAARSALDEADELAGPSPAPGPKLNQLEFHGLLAFLSGDLPAAVRAFEAQRAILHSIGDEYAEANATLSLAETQHACGETVRAIALAREIQHRASRVLGREPHANLLANLAGYLVAVDDLAGARAVAIETIALLAADPGSLFVAIVLEHFALAVALGGEPARAARLLGYSDAALRAEGYEREFTEQATHDRLTTTLRERFTEEDLDALAAEGAALTPQRAIEEALRTPETG